MRILVLLILLSAFEAYAPITIISSPRASTAAAAGATYLLTENFEGTGYDETITGSWTESSGTPDEDYATSPAPLAGSQSLELNDAGANERIDSPTYAATADIWLYFLVHFNSLPAATETVASFRNSTTEMCSMQITSAGLLRVAMTGGNSVTTVSAMSAGTTYHVWIHYTAGSGANAFGSVAFSTDGTKPTSGNAYTQKTDSTATASSDNIRLRSDGAIQLFMDKVRVDDANIGDNPT